MQTLDGARLFAAMWSPPVRLRVVSGLCRFRSAEASRAGGVSFLQGIAEVVLFAEMRFSFTPDYLEIFPECDWMRIARKTLPPLFNELLDRSLVSEAESRSFGASANRRELLAHVFAYCLYECTSLEAVETVRSCISLCCQNVEAVARERLWLLSCELEKLCKNLSEMAASVGASWDWRGAGEKELLELREAISAHRSRFAKGSPRLAPERDLPPAPANDGSVDSAKMYLKWVDLINEMERKAERESRLASLGDEALSACDEALGLARESAESRASVDFLHGERASLKTSEYLTLTNIRLLSLFGSSDVRRIKL